MKRLALVGLLWLGMGGVAQGYSHPTALITTLPTQHPYYIWVGEAKVPTPAMTVQVVEAPTKCGTPTAYANGCTSRYTNFIWLNPFPGPNSNPARYNFLHELGHQFDYRMAQWVRDRFAQLTRQGYNDELFAEAYAVCALWPHVADPLDMAHWRQRKVCRLIRHA